MPTEKAHVDGYFYGGSLSGEVARCTGAQKCTALDGSGCSGTAPDGRPGPGADQRRGRPRGALRRRSGPDSVGFDALLRGDAGRPRPPGGSSPRGGRRGPDTSGLRTRAPRARGWNSTCWCTYASSASPSAKSSLAAVRPRSWRGCRTDDGRGWLHADASWAGRPEGLRLGLPVLAAVGTGVRDPSPSTGCGAAHCQDRLVACGRGRRSVCPKSTRSASALAGATRGREGRDARQLCSPCSWGQSGCLGGRDLVPHSPWSCPADEARLR